MRIGILTFHEIHNPGAFWQALATCQLLSDLGHDPWIINYNSPAHRIEPIKQLWRHPLNILYAIRWPLEFYDTIIRVNAYRAARPGQMRLTSLRLTHAELEQESFDAVLIGSDIVWNFRDPRLGMDPVYFGHHLKTTRLLSWAASMGPCALEGEIPTYVREGIKRFTAISVRDRKTQTLAQSLGATAAKIVCDPSFHLDLARARRGRFPQEPYIALYAIPSVFSAAAVQATREFAAQTGLPVYAINYRNSWADKNFVAADPNDWLSLLENARYVVTNTFHGTLFAIRLHKQFVSEYNPLVQPKLQGVIERLDLGARIFTEGTTFARQMEASIAWDAVESGIATLATEGRQFLTQSLQ